MQRTPFSFWPRLWLLGVCFTLFLAGCVASATSVKYDPGVAQEKTCTLNIINTLNVTSFDGFQVHWKPEWATNWATVQIPEGNHTFTLDYSRAVGGENHFLNGIVVRYEKFEAGHTYLLYGAEGAESRGFMSMFKDVSGTMRDTVRKALRIGIKDVTNEPNWASMSNMFSWQEGFEWLPIY